MKTTRIFFVIASIVLSVHSAFSDDRLGMRSIGMGRAAVSTTRGIDALGINPANIAINDIGYFNLDLPQTSFRVSTQLMSYDIYQKYFTGKDSIENGKTKRVSYLLTEQDKEDIMSPMSDDPVTKINLEEMLAGFSLQTPVIGGIGFGVIDHAGVRMAFSRDFFNLVFLEGLPSNTTYSFNGTSFEAWWYREYNFSYGRKLPIKMPYIKNLYVGAGVKAIQGLGIFETTKNNSSLQNNSSLDPAQQNSLIGSFNFAARRAGVDFFNNDSARQSFTPGMLFNSTPVGKGTGFDAGISAEFFNGARFGVSITDIGKILWNKNVMQTTGNGQIIFTGYTSTIQDSVKKVLKGQNSPGESFITNLPTLFQVGISTTADHIPILKFLPGHILLAAEYAQGLNESLGNTTKARFSFGTEYRVIPLLPLRTGLVIGGDDQLRWSFGFGLDLRVISLDFATDNFGMLFAPKSFNAVSFAFGLKIRV